MIRTLIVDDEAAGRKRLRDLLVRFPDIEVVDEACDGLNALESNHLHQPDLILLDIEMPELNGIEVAKTLTPGPHIVFVTAFNQHALAAFEAAAVDYLVKPVIPERLKESIERVRRLTENEPRAYSEIKLPSQRLAVQTGSRYVILDPEGVSSLQAKSGYTEIEHKGSTYLTEESLDRLGQRLDPSLFVRIHRRAILNVRFLKELKRLGERKYTAVLSDSHKSEIPIARDRIHQIKKNLTIV